MNGTSASRRRSWRPKPWQRPWSSALKDGVEDVYPGDVAQEWLALAATSPKTLEARARALEKPRKPRPIKELAQWLLTLTDLH